ncbi:hypothetical protein HMPREF0979_00754 [Coprobacillus sp. 8_1_38FAA]|uniref:hypothetical protein n=1 Tax=Faecalibacillus faecis TaxID=1982628 RepID=UPI0006722680|nr:hypothetical protein HMPREF0979_00754 [Coprobacillus sp. 8_1_38FAA]
MFIIVLSELTNVLAALNEVSNQEMSFDQYKSIEWRLQKELCRFEMKHPELEMNRFIKILEENDLEWSMNEMHAVDVSKLNLKAVLALLVGIFCSEKCIEESQYSFFQDKKIFQCIERLRILNS